MQKNNSLSGSLLPPLVVDLDGTLLHTDMLHESIIQSFRFNILALLKSIFLLFNGKASFKRYLASKTNFDPASLPYNKELLRWLEDQKELGRKLVLCTASDLIVAESIANHLEIFDEVIASDGLVNNAGENKANALKNKFGVCGYDYVGNSKADIPVWASAAKSILVNASSSLEIKARDVSHVQYIFPRRKGMFKSFVRALRIHQWLKNVLLFVPLLAGHDISNELALHSLLLAFFSFGICASSVYILNDLLDLDSDRAHPSKKTRPFAAGELPIWFGVLSIPLLLALSFYIAHLIIGPFSYVLFFYFIITCAYSLLLKRLVLIDCLVLALLYTIRIIAGALAVNHVLSFWLLAFSVFIFLSLAFVKRYTEMGSQKLTAYDKLNGRGYYTSDASLIQTMGIASGYLSILVFSLYLDSEVVTRLYKSPQLIWGAIPVMLFWISWMWLQANHGKMHDDPLVFAIKNPISISSGVIFVFIMTIGTVGLNW